VDYPIRSSRLRVLALSFLLALAGCGGDRLDYARPYLHKELSLAGIEYVHFDEQKQPVFYFEKAPRAVVVAPCSMVSTRTHIRSEAHFWNSKIRVYHLVDSPVSHDDRVALFGCVERALKTLHART
jgi:hypothetical protein